MVEFFAESLNIKLTNKLLTSLCGILEIDVPLIKLSQFFKNLREVSYKVYQDLPLLLGGINELASSKNVELHENLLKSSQNFRIIYDDDFEKDLPIVSSTIRSLYSRTKSGRPQTSKNLFSPSNLIQNEEDLIIQQMNFEENQVDYNKNQLNLNQESAKVEEEKKVQVSNKIIQNNEEELEKKENKENINKLLNEPLVLEKPEAENKEIKENLPAIEVKKEEKIENNNNNNNLPLVEKKSEEAKKSRGDFD